jgi:hypothetical protein
MGQPPASRFCFDSDLVPLATTDLDHDTVIDDDPFRDWADDPIGLAAGSLATGTSSVRTTTVVDPLTTSVLAEVSRRRPTEEIPPSTLAAALEKTKRR